MPRAAMRKPQGPESPKKPRKAYKRPPIRKIPVAGGKALPGRPRRDGLPPIQRAKPTVQGPLTVEEIRLRGRIGYLAGRGLPSKLLAAKIRREFPGCEAQPEDFEPRGRFYDDVMSGKADAVLEVAEGMFDRAKDGTGKGVDPLFWLKCHGEWAETATARKKTKDADEDDAIVGLDITVTR